jgi:hypothetical protein
MNFYQTLTAAINDFVEHGFDDEERLTYWLEEITKAARAQMIPEAEFRLQLDKTLKTIYDRLIMKGGVLTRMPGVHRFTVNQLKPELRSILDRHIMASANLVKLRREEVIPLLQRRFSGWATSVPAGGTDIAKKAEVKANIFKSLKSLPWQEKRVLIDQSNKLTAAIHQTVAVGGGAIAGQWTSHWREEGYNYRPNHRARDKMIYLVRGSWADEQGLVKAVNGYIDEIEQPGEFVYCRCAYRYIFNLRGLPEEFLSQKGLDSLATLKVVLKPQSRAA